MSIHEEIYDFLKFCREKISIFSIGLVVILAYGLLIIKGAIGVDDENMDYYLSGGLISQDRVGWYLTDKIFSSYDFLPTWTILIGILFFIIGVLLWIYGLDKKLESNFSKGVCTIVAAIVISFPYIGKFAIFNGNMVAIGYTVCFTAVGLYASYFLLEKITIKEMVIVLICLIGVFLFEKAYIMLFCQGIAGYILLKRSANKNIKLIEFVKWLVIICVIIIIALITSRVLINIIQLVTQNPANSYTDNYMKYNLSSLIEFWQSICNFVVNYLYMLAKNFILYYGERIYIFAAIVMISIAISNTLLKKDAIIVLVAVVNIMLSATIYLITGNIWMPTRTICFNYAFFIGITLLYVFSQKNFKKWTLGCIYFICILIIGNQSFAMEEIYYAKYITYEKDKELSKEILSKIEEECGIHSAYNKPIIFMGFLNNFNINYGEVENTSIYIWDRNSSVYIEEQSSRIYNFYDKLGYKINRPTVGINFEEVRRKTSQMEAFPEQGCIHEEENYIIVKLGDSLCEIIDSISEDKYLYSQKIIGNIEWFSYENRTINMGGWLIWSGKNSYQNNISLILKGENSSYKLRIDEKERPDITSYFADGYNYENSGFQTTTVLSEYVVSGIYDVFLELDNGEDKYLYDINQIISVE